MSDDDDRDVLARLAAYRPASPPAELRARVLTPAPPVPHRRPRLPIAAGLTVAALLQWQAGVIDARTVSGLEPRPHAEPVALADAVPGVDTLPLLYLRLWQEPTRRPLFAVWDVDEDL